MEIDNLRSALLALHKAVLAAERGNVERIHGPLSNAEFLQIVQDPLRYGWLKPLTKLILAFDDADEERAAPEELLARSRELLAPPKQKTAFGWRYLSLMQRDPALVLEHAALTKHL